MALSDMLRALTPSKPMLASCCVSALYVYMQLYHPASSLVPILYNLVRWTLYGTIYVLIGVVCFVVAVNGVLRPMFDIILEGAEDGDAGRERKESPPVDQPKTIQDAEAQALPLVKEEKAQSRFVAVAENVWYIGLFFFLLIGSAAALNSRPRTKLVTGTLDILRRAAWHVLLIAAVLVGPIVFVMAPLLVVFIVLNRLTYEPHKTVWATRTQVATRATGGLFAYTVCLQLFTTCFPATRLPPSISQPLPYLTALLFTLGLSAYFVVVLWIASDRVATRLFDRALLRLKLEPAKRILLPWRAALAEWATFFVMPAAMVLDAYAYDDRLLAGARVLLLVTLGAVGVVAADYALYWVYFWAQLRAKARTAAARAEDAVEPEVYTPSETMGILLLGLAVRKRDEAKVEGATEEIGEHLKAEYPAR